MKKAFIFLKMYWQWTIVFLWVTWISVYIINISHSVAAVEWQVSDTHSKIDDMQNTIDYTYLEVEDLSSQ